MSDIETLKAEIKKLSTRATTMKMNLHNLSRGTSDQLGDHPQGRRKRLHALSRTRRRRAKLKQEPETA